jgi:hypothetical protein
MTRRNPSHLIGRAAECRDIDPETVKAARATPGTFTVGQAVIVAVMGHASRPTVKVAATVLDTRANWMCKQVLVSIDGVERWVVADRVKGAV